MQRHDRWLQEFSIAYPAGLAGVGASHHHRKRRQDHLDALEFPALFAGVSREPGTEEPWLHPFARIFQEPALMHLTGINQPGVHLLLDPLAEHPSRREILFLPRRDPAREFWDGPRLGLAPVDSGIACVRENALLARRLGIPTILPPEDLRGVVKGLAERGPTVGVFFHRWSDAKGRRRNLRGDHNEVFAKQVQRWIAPLGGSVVSIAELHFRLRLPLDPWQQQEAARAQSWAGEAFEELLPRLPRFGRENQAAAFLESAMLGRSPYGLAFPTICASGSNAAILHYMRNDSPLNPGEMLLVDFGCRSATMHADISRTVPLSGRYSRLQRLLLDIVLEVQALHAGRVRPGRTLRELNILAWEDLERLLSTRFLAHGGTSNRPYVEGGLRTLPRSHTGHPRQPHGISHLMGEQEHDGDPFRIYLDWPLCAGWMISNEPGLYGTFSLGPGKETATLGIRVEDNLLVTNQGCENLSSGIPSDPAVIENFIHPRRRRK